MDKTIAILEQARRVLKGGKAWTRCHWHVTRPTEQYCLVGAIRQSVNDLELKGRMCAHTQPVYRLLADQITTPYPVGKRLTPMWRIVHFNDSRPSYRYIDKLLTEAIAERRASIAKKRVHVAESDLSVSGD